MKGKLKTLKQNSIIKKFILIAVIITMLSGDFILPIKLYSIAKEYEEIEKSVSESISKTSGNDANNMEKDDKTKEVDEKKLKASNEETVENSEVNSEENSKNENKGESENQENKVEKADSNIVEDTMVEENENSADNEDEESAKQPSIMKKAPVGLLNTNNSLSFPQAQNNNENEEKTLEELDKEIKSTTKETIEERKQNNTYKEKNNLYEIRKFETEILSGAKKDENGNLVWSATTNNSGHEFTFRVNYELSGYKEIAAGAFKVTIPKRILRNRNGNLDDNYEMSLPTLAECKEEGKIAELIYKEDGDYLVIYNPEPVDAGLNGYFEISYATNSATYNYKDYNPSNTELVKLGGTASDGFYAILELSVDKDADNSENNGNTKKDILNNITEDKNVFINTNVELKSTQKRYPSIFRDWDSSWMEQDPADKDDYYYLVWEISSYIENITQKYNFSLEDFVTNLTDGTENQTLNGTRYDYVLTRHKRSTFGGRSYKLKNTITAKVHPTDGVDEDTQATSSNIFSWNPAFVPPTGHFNNFKYGNNNWYERFRRYWNYANYDLDKLQSGEVSSLKNFKYYTETVGYAYPWTLKDGGDTENFRDYGINNVNYETFDENLYLEDDENPMNTDDYYLEYFTYSISNSDAEFDDFYNKFNTISPVYADDEIITFYAKFGDRELEAGNTWVQIGTYNSKYPVIYGSEKLKTVYGWDEYDLSEQARLIERNEGDQPSPWMEESEVHIGAINYDSLNRPYHTYYNLNYNDLNIALGDRADIVLPNGASTGYWIASRCINTNDSNCDFNVRDINGGNLECSSMFNSNGDENAASLSIFPVVTIKAELLSEESNNVYKVEE